MTPYEIELLKSKIELLQSMAKGIERIEKRLAALEQQPLPKAKTNRKKLDLKAIREDATRQLLNINR